MFGSFSLLFPIVGVVLGVGAGRNANGSYIPPSIGWVLALTVLGVFDSLAGATAASTYLATTVALGGVPAADGARSHGRTARFVVRSRSGRGRGATVAAGTVAQPRRPLDRATDAVLAPLFGMWGAEGIVWAQNGLSGHKLPITGAKWPASAGSFTPAC